MFIVLVCPLPSVPLPKLIVDDAVVPARVKLVAAPKAVTVVAFVLNRVRFVVAVATVGESKFIVLVPEVVPIEIVVVPPAAPPVPMLIVLVAAVTAPVPMFKVDAPVTEVLKFKVEIADAFKFVAFVNVRVVLPIVAVPVEDPNDNVVADVALKVVALLAVNVELKTATVPFTAVVPMLEVAMLTVKVPVEIPKLTFDAPVLVPPVPMLTVFKLEPLFPVAMLRVEVAVVAANVMLVDSPNIEIPAEVPVKDVALGYAIVALLVVAVPVVAPSVREVAEPKIVAVVAEPNTAKDAGFAEAKTVAKVVPEVIEVA